MNEEKTFLSIFAEKEKKRFKLKVGVFLFLIENDQILLLRRHKTGIDDGFYVVPMGAIEGDEIVTSAVIREAVEEANILLKPENLEMCHVMHRFHSMPQGLSFEQIDIFFRAEKYVGNVQNLEPHKCDELSFYPLENLPIKTAPFIRYAIDCMLSGKLLSEFGWEGKAF